ncbi:hypothetical protein [Actinomadura rupiterrae]|uniref:hypothetical protein n=1 Tax=Actinomadura rupiterrae TaxID=559627 RepID=UPI0020A2E2FF|nr:hypothetical protein [Actinomadura rupiterrae]MCP2341154.1 hypothetical protein [Actinomadura rupiterrae]
MNEATIELLFDVVARLERNIAARQAPAICGLDGDRRLTLSDYDYLRDRATACAFEQRVADYARRIHARRWVLAVPMIITTVDDPVFLARPVTNLVVLRQDEQEAIVWTAFDPTDGIDYGIVAYTRRPNLEPVFDEPEVFTAPLTNTPLTPGATLLQATLGDGD